MTRKLSDIEKYEHKLKREEKASFKEQNPEVDKYGTKILRILREEAPEHPGVKYNSLYFENRFKVSNITILRAIKKLKKHHLIKDKQSHGSYVIDENVSESYYTAETKKNIALVASLGGVLQQYERTPLYESVKDLIYFLQPEIAKNDNVFSSGRIIVSPQMEYDINLKNWNKVYEAMQINHKIKFRYTKSYTNTKATRIVCPYQLILDNGSVYIFAFSDYAQVPILYDLNFMAEIVITPQKFELPKDYDFNNHCGGGRLGAYKGNKVDKYKIRFTGYAKDWIKLHKWADDQKFTEDEDSTTISFSSSQYDKILELILSWGAQAEPLAPARLVKQWKDEITALYKMISGEE